MKLTGWDHTLQGGGSGVTPQSVYAGQQPFIQTGQGARNGVSQSVAQAGEYFNPQMARAFREAKAAKIEHEGRFGTGPSAYLWRDGTDGAPMRQGAEVAKSFYNSGAAQTDDIAQFNRMVSDDNAQRNGLLGYAMADLLEKSVLPNNGLLSNAKLATPGPRGSGED